MAASASAVDHRRGLVSSADQWQALKAAVAAYEPQVVVLVARKTPRMDELLELELGGTALRVTDLALPFVTHYLAGTRVAVVDDLVNVGTTLARAAEQVTRAGAREVQMFAIARRADTEPIEAVANCVYTAETPMSAPEHHRFSAGIPDALSRLNKPYDLDFPVMEYRLAPGFRHFDDFVAHLREQFAPEDVFDVSAVSPRLVGRRRITIQLGDGNALCKVRLYVDEVSGQVNVVPMRLDSPLATDVDDLPAQHWAREFWQSTTAGLEGLSAPEQFECRARLSLFIRSLDLGMAAVQRLRLALDRASNLPFNVSDAALSFGPTIGTAYIPQSVWEAPPLRDATAGSDNGQTSDFWAEVVDSSFLAAVEQRQASSDLICRFEAFFEELAHRAGASSWPTFSLPAIISRDRLVSDPYQRLRVGPTFGDLLAFAAKTAPQAADLSTLRRAVSKLLDFSVDGGFVVPTFANYRGHVYRVYRKGEPWHRVPAVSRVQLGMVEYRSLNRDDPNPNGLSITRVSKVAAILSLSEPNGGLGRITPLPRGNGYSLDDDLLDAGSEIASFMRRTGQMIRIRPTKTTGDSSSD